jgi:DNA-binding transcriptional LysR family regulator
VTADTPDLNLLVALRALLEEANVTRAGERIRMGQSTMSVALARLREQFDDELLVRVGRDYELTPLARQLLPRVQSTLPLIEQILSTPDGPDYAGSRRTFAIQLTDYAAVEIRPLLHAITGSAPGVRIDLIRGPGAPGPAERDLFNRDFVVAVPGVGIEGDSIELFRDEYVVIADRDHPAVAGGEITMADFLSHPHARFDLGQVLNPVQRRMRELDIDIDVRVSTSSQLPLPSIVSGTQLLSVVPRRLAERSARATGTVAVPTPFESVELIERMWWHPAHAHDPAHRWFREQVVAAVERGVLA